MKEFLTFVYSLEGQTLLAKAGQPADAGRHRGRGGEDLDQRYPHRDRGHEDRPHAVLAGLQRHHQQQHRSVEADAERGLLRQRRGRLAAPRPQKTMQSIIDDRGSDRGRRFTRRRQHGRRPVHAATVRPRLVARDPQHGLCTQISGYSAADPGGTSACPRFPAPASCAGLLFVAPAVAARDRSSSWCRCA